MSLYQASRALYSHRNSENTEATNKLAVESLNTNHNHKYFHINTCPVFQAGGFLKMLYNFFQNILDH